MRFVHSRFTVAVLLAASLPLNALATNGYFTHGVSTADKALGGAGVALSQDTLAAANNPAGMAWQGRRYDVGAALFMPMRGYSADGRSPVPVGSDCSAGCPFSVGDGTQSIDSDNEAFLIPSFGYNRDLDNSSSFGLSVFGNGGMNTEYKGGFAFAANPGTNQMDRFPGSFGGGTAGVDLSQLFVAATYARRLSETSAWGISGILAHQRFEARGIAPFGAYSVDPGNLSNNGVDSSSGIGLRLGFQSLLSPGLRFGIAYQPKIDMGEFDDYAGLFAEQGDFDIPSNLTIGLALNLGENGIVLIDLQQIYYEDVAAVSNPIDSLNPASGLCAPNPFTGGTGDGCLGASDGAGFGWQDMTVIKLGYQWQTDQLTWRVGASSTSQPVPDDEVLFNILAPGVIEQHLTFGFTRQIDADSSFDFAAMYAPSKSVSGISAFDPAQEIELEMDQYELVFSYNRRL